MPMQSKAQRAFLWANHPDVAAKFEAETPNGKKLPDKVKRGLLSEAVPAQRPRAGELRLKRRHTEDGKFYGHGEAVREACMSPEEMSTMIDDIDRQLNAYRNNPSSARPGRESPIRWGAPTHPAAGPVGNGPIGVGNLGYPA